MRLKTELGLGLGLKTTRFDFVRQLNNRSVKLLADDWHHLIQEIIKNNTKIDHNLC